MAIDLISRANSLCRNGDKHEAKRYFKAFI
jgi:hypothetical protein